MLRKEIYQLKSQINKMAAFYETELNDLAGVHSQTTRAYELQAKLDILQIIDLDLEVAAEKNYDLNDTRYKIQQLILAYSNAVELLETNDLLSRYAYELRGKIEALTFLIIRLEAELEADEQDCNEEASDEKKKPLLLTAAWEEVLSRLWKISENSAKQKRSKKEIENLFRAWVGELVGAYE